LQGISGYKTHNTFSDVLSIAAWLLPDATDLCKKKAASKVILKQIQNNDF